MKRKDLKHSEMREERRCEEIEIEVRKGAKMEERRMEEMERKTGERKKKRIKEELERGGGQENGGIGKKGERKE